MLNTEFQHPRPSEIVQRDLAAIYKKVGELSYRLECGKIEINKLLGLLGRLNREAAAHEPVKPEVLPENPID